LQLKLLRACDAPIGVLALGLPGLRRLLFAEFDPQQKHAFLAILDLDPQALA